MQVQPDLTHLAFEVDSLEEFGRHLGRLGLKYSDGPHLDADGGGIAFIDAPEGYEIELIQMASPARVTENPNAETRNPKEIRRPKSEGPASSFDLFGLRASGFGLPSGFGFRVSGWFP